jgi:hypothetical protein
MTLVLQAKTKSSLPSYQGTKRQLSIENVLKKADSK